MASEIITYCFKNDLIELNVRALLDVNGEVWFVAKDLADILGYSDAHEMTCRLDDDEVNTRAVAGFGNRGINLINESGLYSAILGSRKYEAKKFKKWVTSEVLPSIRKTGQYVKPIEKISEAEALAIVASLQAYADMLCAQLDRECYTLDDRIKAKFRQLEHRHGKNAHDALEHGMANFAAFETEGEFAVAKPSDHYEYACVDRAVSLDRFYRKLSAVISPNVKLIESSITQRCYIHLTTGKSVELAPACCKPVWARS